MRRSDDLRCTTNHTLSVAFVDVCERYRHWLPHDDRAVLDDATRTEQWWQQQQQHNNESADCKWNWCVSQVALPVMQPYWSNRETHTPPLTDSSASANSDSSDGMQTWQIALIICCAALVFIVAAVALLSCYCKARRRLNESEDHDADATYYHQPFAAVGGPSGGSATRIAASTSGTDYYDSNRQTYGKAAMGATPGSYSGSDSRYATALTSAENSPERISPGVSGGYASVGRPSSGSVGDASTPYGYDRRMSNQHSQAVTL